MQFEVKRYGCWWWAILNKETYLYVRYATSRKLVLFRRKQDAEEFVSKLIDNRFEMIYDNPEGGTPQ